LEFVGERMKPCASSIALRVFALDVFDDRDFQRVAIADIDRHDRHFVQAGDLRPRPSGASRR